MAQAAEDENAYEAAREERERVLHLEVPLDSIEKEPFAEGGFGYVFRGMCVIADHCLDLYHPPPVLSDSCVVER